jgi:polar amino acid transport system substrate-binding protein
MTTSKSFFGQRWAAWEMAGIICVIALFGWILYLNAATRTDHQTIKIVTSLLPPYMDELGEGQEAEIIRAALTAGYREVDRSVTVEFYVQSFSRHWMSFLTDSRYDAVTTVPEAMRIQGFRSDRYVDYQNGVGYRKSSFPDGFAEFDFDKLAGHRVIAFAGAAGIIPGLKAKRDIFSLYLEEPDQRIHSKLLLEDVIDVVLADGKILSEYNRRLTGGRGIPDEAFAAVFCPTPYRMVFRSNEVREKFDRGLAIITGSGKLAAINARFFHDGASQQLFDHTKCL